MPSRELDALGPGGRMEAGPRAPRDHASVRSGNRGPTASAFGPRSGVRPVMLMWSAMTMSVPAPNDGSRPPAALVRTIVGAPSRPMRRTGWTTRPGSLPS